VSAVAPPSGGIATRRTAGSDTTPAGASLSRDRFGVRMKSNHASSEGIGLRAPCIRRRPSATARFCVVVAAALLGAAAPGGAGAAGLDQLAGNIADQVQEAAWNQAGGAGASTSAAQAPTADVGQRVEEVTRAALSSARSATTSAVVHESAGALAGVTPAETVGDALETGGVEATPRAAVKQVPRARPHEKARPRGAAAAASPIPVSRPTGQVEGRASPEPGISTRERGDTKPNDAPGAAHGPRAPSLPFDLPPLPLPLAMPSSVGAGSGGGPSVPALLVALTAAIFLYVSEVLIRRVPSRRPARPRRIVLPPWRPG
jgi:hypothetical protein